MYHPMTVHKWSGLGDGRLTAQQLNTLIDASDDHYVAAAERLKNVDILIIDEISMLSKCMFDKLEAVMRHVRGKSQVFGGAQLVVVGDFLQLPPVRNSRYNDQGEFSFQSEVFPLHRIFLSHVMRQKDEHLIQVIHNIAIGNVDQETTTYVKHLRRPLTQAGPDTTRLFSVNILADIYNRDCLMKVNGDVFQFEATDEGEERYLNTLTVQKTLWLKKNAKVMLLRNLSDQLVNGLCGTVVGVREGEVDVHFKTLSKTATLTRMNFAVFDPACNRNLAVRNQVPLKLCYAITVHKAQGMTLDRAEVDCRQMFQSGQLAVAMGRVKSPDGLRVVNFTKDAVIPQPSLVLDFLNSQWIPGEVDRSCCHIIFNRNVNEVELDGTILSAQPLDSDIDFDDDTTELLAGLEIESLISESQNTVQQPNLCLPEDVKIEEKLISLKFQDPLRENQTVYNDFIQYLLDNNKTTSRVLCNTVLSSFGNVQ
ncbi:uncharacterized protein LOC132755555 [Ruditapes philippinarum]|uniref:uncharacterized protein LOC132755555 n=1 Tax=Ruditapes philippinarum TaxID=129788 RepID=UPI00295B9B9D|nr:uncharacterized protein LOC132755555 [Ruditapes philippinarum]